MPLRKYPSICHLSLVAALLSLMGCAFLPPTAWTLPVRTIQVPARGEVGQYLTPFLLLHPDSLRIIHPPELQVFADVERDTLIIKSMDDTPANHLVTLATGKHTAILAVRVTPRLPVTFHYRAQPGVSHDVYVTGSFTDWQSRPMPLHDLDRDGTYQATTYLDPQRHEYKLIVDGNWITDPDNPDRMADNRGGFNSVLDLRERTAGSTGFFIRREQNGRHFRFQYYQPPNTAKVEPGSVVILVDNTKLPRNQWKFNPDTGELKVSFHIKARGFVRILAQDQEGRICRETQFILDHGKTITATQPLETWYTRTIYFPMTDRFFDGNPFGNWSVPDPQVRPLDNYIGGDLEGIAQKIEEGYFDSLGISALWISPLNQGPDSAFLEYAPPHSRVTGYHGSWPVHPTQVDPRIGGRAAALELVETAHERGLKVILDVVTNHTHRKHPYFQGNRDWFSDRQLTGGRDNIQLWGEYNHTTWLEPFLPSFDYLRSHKALEAMTDNTVWWLETFELDGFRHDAVNRLPHQFWITLTRKLRERFPDRTFYQVGESYGSDALIKTYVNSAMLDGQFNNDLYFGTREVFALGTGSMVDVAKTLEQNLSVYDPLNLMGTLVSSPDQVRFISLADRKVSFTEDAREAARTHPPSPAGATAHERLRLYYTFILTLPGVPIVYYGDEIGMAGAGEPDNRRPMKWANWSENEQATFDAISQLIHLRRSHPALAVGDLMMDQATEHLLSYRRLGFEEEFLILLNKGEQDGAIQLPGEDDHWQAVYGAADSWKSGDEVIIPARSGVICRRR